MKSKLAIWSAFFAILPFALMLVFLILGSVSIIANDYIDYSFAKSAEGVIFFVFFGGLPLIITSLATGTVLGFLALRAIKRNPSLEGVWLARIGAFALPIVFAIVLLILILFMFR